MKRPNKLEPGIKGYHQWQKAILNDQPLRDIAGKGYFDIRLIAIAIGAFGASGRGCFAAEEVVAGQIGCHRNVVAKYRRQLIDLGWFTVVARNGGSLRRGLVLDISLPEESSTVPGSWPRPGSDLNLTVLAG